jgi:hypothetical protein
VVGKHKETKRKMEGQKSPLIKRVKDNCQGFRRVHLSSSNTHLVCQVGIRAVLKQHLDDLGVALIRRPDERSPSILVRTAMVE